MLGHGTLTIKIKDFDARHNATFPSDFIIGSQFGFNTEVFKIDGENLSRNVNCNFLLKLKKSQSCLQIFPILPTKCHQKT